MAGYGPPPGPYIGFQPGVQPIGFEMHNQGYPPPDNYNSPGYPPPPPPQDIYHPTRNDNFATPATPAAPSYHNHGGENDDNLPPVGFEGITKPKDQDTATTSGVKLHERESPVPPIELHSPKHRESHQVNVKRASPEVCIPSNFILFLRVVCCTYASLGWVLSLKNLLWPQFPDSKSSYEEDT